MKELKAALENYSKATTDLLIAWDKAVTNPDIASLNIGDYPFEKSFDEIDMDVRNWTEEYIENLEARLKE